MNNSRSCLIEKYEKSCYIAYIDNHKLIIHAGKQNVNLDTLLLEHQMKTACFITAWNPFSKVRPHYKNSCLNFLLFCELKLLSRPIFHGVGISIDEDYLEKSFLVLGLSKVECTKLGEKYQQNAFIFHEIHQRSQLILLF